MAKRFIRRHVSLIDSSGSLAANAIITGSSVSQGLEVLRGMWFSDVATSTGSGLLIQQSSDFGQSWNLISASDQVGACGTQTYDVTLLGNAVKVTACNGAAIASNVQATFYLLP